ncbi:hypothetical protein ACQKWADRAFT_306811 [Trichoderma austrokoningii]
MEAEPSPATISGRARACFISFHECLRQIAPLDPQKQSLVENEFARFSVWTSNIGVFASGRASMDHRLREAPDIQRLVIGMLEVINGRIEQYLGALKTINHSSLETSDSRLIESSSVLEHAIESMASEIMFLHELSNTTRKASREANNVKAALSFNIKDQEGNDLEKPLKTHFAANIKDRFPGISDIIRLRLAETMILRRKRVLYKRARYSKVPMKITHPSTQPIIQPPDHSHAATAPQHIEEQLAITSLEASPPEETQSIAISATTLIPETFQKAATPSVISHSNTIALGRHEDLYFPPAPAHISTAAEAVCPYCLLMLPIQEIENEKKWRDHVKNDLEPYVCLAEDCDCPNELYRHSDEWLRHMRKHAMRWRCASKSHKTVFFDTREDYISHMKQRHRRAVTDEQIAILADRSLQLTGPIFKSCPLCGARERDNSGSLGDHIAGHLRSLALKSLPPVDDGDEQTNDAERRSETDSRSKIVQHDPDLNFDSKFDSYDKNYDYFLPKIPPNSSTLERIQQDQVDPQDRANVSMETILTEVKLELFKSQTDSSMYDSDDLFTQIYKWLQGVYSGINRYMYTNASDAS